MRVQLPYGKTTITVGREWSAVYFWRAHYIHYVDAGGPFVTRNEKGVEIQYERYSNGGFGPLDRSIGRARAHTLQFRCDDCGTNKIALTLEVSNSQRPKKR